MWQAIFNENRKVFRLRIQRSLVYRGPRTLCIQKALVSLVYIHYTDHYRNTRSTRDTKGLRVPTGSYRF